MPEFIELGGVRTAYEVQGSGPALLMLHGAEGSRRQFAAIAPELADRYTVITYDQRDCGETTGAASPAKLSDLADDAHALLGALGHGEAHLFGTSFGGRVAQALAVRHPACVRRLVLAHTWPLSTSLAAANAEVAQQMALLRDDLPASAEMLASYFFPARFLDEHPVYRGHFKAAPPRSERTQRRYAAVSDLPELDITRIAMPTLLIAGDLDRVVPLSLTLALSQSIPNTRAVVLPDVGHLSLTQVPQTVAQHLREFLG